MRADTLSQRTIAFVNIGHALDHFVLLIYPTAVITIAAERGVDYGALIGLATGAYVAFGLFSLPMGWLAARLGRRNLLAIFFGGCGLACLGLSTATSPPAFAAWLLILGVFSAIYHPIGSAMLVTHARRLGRDLGWNGVWGNLGAASASGITALIAAALGWRAAFVMPGLVCLAAGAIFVTLVPGDGDGPAQRGSGSGPIGVARPVTLLAVFAIAVIAGGMTFNVTTIGLPKIIDERLGFPLPLTLTGTLATAVFVFGALTQLALGRLVDRFSPAAVFVGISILQPIGLGLAAVTTGVPVLVGLVLAMAAIYGQVVVNDAIVARYVPPAHRAKAFSVRYFLGFTTSGFAVPLIAFLHGQGGFSIVLAATAAFGATIFICALAFMIIAQPRPTMSHAPAE